MISVDFYILPDASSASLQTYACKLAEKSWLKGQRTLIQTDSHQDSQIIDEQLWNLREDSFIPHGIATLEPSDAEQPILISHQALNPQIELHRIINISSHTAHTTSIQNLNIEELLNQDEARKQLGRQHYKVYREQGYQLQHHTLEPHHEP